MKNTVKYLAIMVVALTVSSALFAAQGGNSKNCSATPSTDAAIWGNSSDSLSGSSSGVISPCQNSTTGRPTIERSNNQEHGLGNAFGKLFHMLSAAIEATTWGGGGNYGPPR